MATSDAGRALASYLPKTLRARIGGTQPLSAAEIRKGTGAVLLSDVEGFTALVEQYGKRGREGLEELTWTLNRYVSDLVGVIDNAGGDVLSIAGDALLCYWPADDNDLAHATRQATRAGFAIQKLLREHDPAAGPAFQTRIGIGAGEVSLAFVGGHDGRWDIAAGGNAFRDAADAEKAAKSGEVLLAHNAWKSIESETSVVRNVGEHVSIAELTAPAAVVGIASTQALTIQQLRPYLPLSVSARLSESEGHDVKWLAETRQVSVLLTDLPALSSGDADELALVHAAVHAFQEIVERCEGASKVDLDEKGVLLLAAFGVPPRAHENDAERAAHAATLISAAFKQIGVQAGIGIATGRAFCGAFGSDIRRDYMIRGDVINLAARLMRAAEGGVRCDGATVDAVRGRMEFETLAAIPVKGRSAPVQLYRPVARRDAVTARAGTMVGRERECSMLAHAVGSIAQGEGTLILIEGDAGLGKSTLLAYARERAEGRARILVAAGDAIERTTPYFAWRQTFAAIFEIPADADVRAVRARVAQHMEAFPQWQRLAPLLSDVLAVRIEDNEITAEMAADVRNENRRVMLAGLLRSAAQTEPLMLAVEDAHWLDSGSWALLLEVARTVQPLLLVVTTRPLDETAPDEYARVAQLAREHCRLESLSDADTTLLAARTLGVSHVPAALATFVNERVSGHPFFCEELVRTMRDVGAIRVDDGSCVIGDLTSFDLPTTVEGVVVSRLDRLTPTQQLCLKVASVIGRLFRARVLEETHPSAPADDSVRSTLAELSAMDLTQLDSPEPDVSYLFRHVITRDVTYSMMPVAYRQPLHRAVALWHERYFADDLAPHYGLLAYHWARAADTQKAVEFLEKAGRYAVRTGAFREGVVLLAQALELMDSDTASFSAERRALSKNSKGIAHYYLGEMRESRTHLTESVGALHRPVPSNRAAVIRGALSAVGRQVLHRVAPKRYLGRRSADKQLLDEAVEGYKQLTQAIYMEGAGPEWLLYLTASGLNLGEEAGDSASLARVMINASMMAYLMGLRGESDRFAKRAIAMTETETLYAAGAYVWHLHSLTLAQQAEWGPMKAAFAKAVELAEESGDRGVQSDTWQVRSTAAHVQGDFNYAPTAWMRLREAGEQNGSAALRCWSLLDEIETRLATGNTEEAVRALDEALAIPTLDSDIPMQLEKLRGIAGTRLRQGGVHAREALEAADSLLALLQRTPPTGFYMTDHYAAAIDVYLTLARESAALDGITPKALVAKAGAACKQLAKFRRTFVPVQPRLSLLNGIVSAQLGQTAAARKHFLSAESRAAALDMPLDHGRSLLERARLNDARDDRDALLAEADLQFERAGATWYKTGRATSR